MASRRPMFAVVVFSVAWVSLLGGIALAHEEGHEQHASHDDVNLSALPEGGQREAIYKEIVELQDQIEHYEERIRLRDVIGGVGYIVGIAGVAFFFLGIRHKQPRSDT